MRKISAFILFVVFCAFAFSCAEKGETGPAGKDAAETVLTAVFQRSVSPAGVADEAVADSYISSLSNTTNYGASVQILCGRQVIIPGGQIAFFRPLIKFDTTILPPGGVEVTEAYLEFYAESYTAGAGVTITAFPLTSSWVESEVTHQRRSAGATWTQAGGDYDETLPGEPVYLSSDVAGKYAKIPLNIEAVAARINNPDLNNGYILGGTTVLTNFVTFASSDAAELERRPKMVIKYRLK